MLFHPLNNNRGLALIFMVLLFAAAATASVMFISLGIKVKGIQKQGTTQKRLSEIRTALQNYYLINYDLPDPSLTNPANSVPTVLLNLPQKYRFDSNGQMIHYGRLPANGHMTTVRNIQVHGLNPENEVAAVLVAPGPDKSIDPNNLASPYDDPANPANDDIVLAVSLEAEALKVANHTVAVLQQAAKAYDSIFYGINNDLDTLYYPPETIWVDITPPTPVMQWVPPWIPTGAWHPNYSGGTFTTYNPDGTTTTTAIGLGNEYVEPYPQDVAPYIPLPPESIIDEDGYTPAQGGTGSGCVRIADVGMLPVGVMLANDPDRGAATLDDCLDPITLLPRDPAFDLAVAYGLNLVKLGYDADSGSLLDPWGNPYLWGAAQTYGGLAQSSTAAQDQIRDRHYWTFYSSSYDNVANTADDILPPADRIIGYFLTPPVANPIP